MKNISFAMTTKQILNQSKSVTRRFAWWSLKEGAILQPVLKSMGLKKGESIVKLGCPIGIISVRGEPLNVITQEDVIREGFPEWTPDQFVQFLVSKYKCDRGKEVNRIEFRYLEPLLCDQQRSIEVLLPSQLLLPIRTLNSIA